MQNINMKMMEQNHYAHCLRVDNHADITSGGSMNDFELTALTWVEHEAHFRRYLDAIYIAI